MENPDSYEFYFLGGENNIYFFVTQHDIAYEVKLKPFPYLFDSEEIYASYIYEFIIAVYSNPTNHTPPLDKGIAFTIATIFDDFYQRFDKTITVYICDSSDSKQLARQRKFSSWFLSFRNEAYFKSDAVLISEDGEIVPVSIIFRRDNPYKYQIIQAFERITDGYERGGKD
ncbi:MAG: DUF6169 family protein [Spirosomataceae bacterium]